LNQGNSLSSGAFKQETPAITSTSNKNANQQQQ
jgi:hypothetical protein